MAVRLPSISDEDDEGELIVPPADGSFVAEEESETLEPMLASQQLSQQQPSETLRSEVEGRDSILIPSSVAFREESDDRSKDMKVDGSQVSVLIENDEPSLNFERRSSSSTKATNVRNLGVSAQFLINIVVVLVAIGAIAVVSFFVNTRCASPAQDLQLFVDNERSRTEVSVVEDLPTDSFHHFAQANCAGPVSFEAAKANLEIQLQDIPEKVRDKVVKRMLVEGISQKNSMQDAVSTLANEGRAQSYMAFWSTQYQTSINPSQEGYYEYCVVVAGVDMQAAEIVAEYKTKTTSTIAGYEPCHCGLVYCERCPVFTEETTMTPIFKRHSLSLKQQNDLHSLMTSHALQAADSIVAGVGAVAEIVDMESVSTVKQLEWKKPDIDDMFRG